MAQIKINNIVYGSSNATDIFYNGVSVADKLDEIITIDIEDNANIDNSENDNLTYGHIVDNLISDDTNKVLSAKQGKVLHEKINNIDFSKLENAISTNSKNINNLDNKINSNTNLINTNINNIKTNSSNITTINNKIPFKFGVDANGNYGYIKDGADTVTPFNQYNFTLSNSEITKGDAAKTYTYTVSEKGKYLVKMFNTSCEGYNSTFTLTTTNGTNIIFANDDVISATTSKSRTRILLAICDMEVNGVISCAKTNAAGYGIHGMYVYKIN